MTIKFGSQGAAVKKYKDMLLALGYLKASTHSFFGRDSEKATKQFQADHGLVVDGIIGRITAAAITDAYNEESKPDIPSMEQYSGVLSGKTLIKYGSKGPVVKAFKDMLMYLGFLSASSKETFGRDSEKATKLFQASHNLEADGIIGPKTGAAILEDYRAHYVPSQPLQTIVQHLDPAQYPHINPAILAAINLELQDETEVRIELVKEDLKWVMPHGMYVFGYNLYTTKLLPTAVTKDGIRSVAARHPSYYTKGRLDYQLGYVDKCEKDGVYLSGCDCSGKEVGLYRKLQIFPPKWDCKAHWLFHSYCASIAESELRPGDLVFKRTASGRITHCAMYVGAGYICEAAGTAYGIQLTDNVNHLVKNNITGELETHTKFNVFGRPGFIA